MLEEFEKIEGRYAELERRLADPEVVGERLRYSKLAKELADLSEKVSLYRKWKKIANEIKDLQGLLQESKDAEFLELARKELNDLTSRKEATEAKLNSLLSEHSEDLDKDIIVEIRAGTGGKEAGLFAADLYRMYTKYAAKKAWLAEIISSHSTELGGYKEIIFGVRGKEAYKRLKYESGVHRVQRVPQTEASGRIHTSTATVAVLIEPQEVDLTIDPKELKIDVFRSSGPGGQGVNTTDSAVRITHLPTGMVITCQDERSQLKNKNKAMRVLRARLLEAKIRDEYKKVSAERKSQIGSGERSEKIRTYNFPSRRITDHRIGLTIHRLEDILEGDLDEMVDSLIRNSQESKR